MCTTNCNHMMCETEFFVVLDHFLPFYPPNNLKIKILKKWKKSSGDIIILYMHHKWQTYVWLLRYGAQQTEFFVILDRFLTFYPPKDPENQNFEKAKKKPGYIILHLCTVNDNYMMYGFWDMECGRQNFSSFWTIFLPFYSTNNLKNKKLEKIEKKILKISLFYTSAPKIMIINYTVPEIDERQM